MSRRILRSQGDICQLCDFILAKQNLARPRYTPRQPTIAVKHFATSRRLHVSKPQTSPVSSKPIQSTIRTSRSNARSYIVGDAVSLRVRKELEEIKKACEELLSKETAPSEAEILKLLNQCEILASELVLDPAVPEVETTDSTAASALLSLDETSTKEIKPEKHDRAMKRLINELSGIVYSIARDPIVFIAPSILEKYVAIQSTLGKPETFPEVFHLYGHKPIPQPNTSPIKYSQPNPNKPANAVPKEVADRALQAAITTKELEVALDIIENTYSAKAFRRAKFIKTALVPTAALSLAPFAAYQAATKMALFQDTMDPAMATNVAFAGLLAYVGLTASIGVVALTTANDQMDRVTWAVGLPLRERWIREEERAAIDKVAVSWGFREKWKRGDEEGEDWETLRDWIGRRGMILDRVELMEGME
ncbi:hypothetical protein F5884DRAFT_363293 [Xylogone sp. PMI_703]|nr:hypothetical protein F5884DRAFT_363293 [Xylogone sp. PMI_703]